MKLRALVSFLMLGILAACGANTSNYMEQGGSRWVIGSGGSLFIDGTLSGTAFDSVVKVKKQALSAAVTSAGVLSWANPTASTIIIERVILDVTTDSTGASTVDCGIGSSATAISDTLLDGIDTGTAAALFDTITNKGSNGATQRKMTASQYLTCSQATGTVTGLVGNAYIHYIPE